MLGALIGAGGSLLSGLFGSRSQKKAEARQREYDKPVNVRARYEEAGVNPLLAFQGGVVGQSAPVSSENYMGAAIADAALIAADAMTKNKAAQQLERVQRVNQKLQQQVTDLTIRPKVGGIYDQRVATPTVRQALGVEDGGRSGLPVYGAGSQHSGNDSSVSDPDGLRPLTETVPVDPRRAADHKAVGSTSGFMAVDNPYLDRPLYFPTIDGDEALQWYDWPTLAIGYAGNWAFDRYLKPARIGAKNSDDYVKEKYAPKPKAREYWTHPQTGFSAPRVPFGFH